MQRRRAAQEEFHNSAWILGNWGQREQVCVGEHVKVFLSWSMCAGPVFDIHPSALVHTRTPSGKAQEVGIIGRAARDSRAKNILQAAVSREGTPRAEAGIEVGNLIPDRLVCIRLETDGLGPDKVRKGVVDAIRQTATPRAKLHSKPPVPLT